jgi:hypothetical protein
MRDCRSVKQRPGVGHLGGHLRHWILRVFGRVASNRAERLHLADGFDPLADMRTRCPPPALNRECEMTRPQERLGDNREHLIVRLIAKLNQFA